MEDLIHGERKTHSRPHEGNDSVRRERYEMLVRERRVDNHLCLLVEQAEHRNCVQVRVSKGGGRLKRTI